MPMPITAILIRKRSSQALQIGHPSNVDVRPRTKYIEPENLEGETLINEFNWNWGDFSPPDGLSKKVRIREYVHLDSWRRAQTFLLIQTVQKVHNSNAIVGQSYKGLVKHSLEISGFDLVEMWEKVKRQKARVVAINWSHVAIVPPQSPWLVGCQHIFCKGSCRLSIKRTPHPLWHFTNQSQLFAICRTLLFFHQWYWMPSISLFAVSQKHVFHAVWCTWDRAKEHIVRLICAAVHMNVGHNIHCKDETTCRIMIPCIHEVQCYLKCETTRQQAAADSSDSKTKPPMVLLQTCDIPILPHF